MRNKYDDASKVLTRGQFADAYPQVWKTIGDEIILCCRVHTAEHLALCVSAFVTATKNYGTYLDESERQLDVKASAWIAAFPEPNATVLIAGRESIYTLEAVEVGRPTDEKFELAADNDPGKFDFLGKHIDAGFRVARFATTDGLALSIELAYLLSEYCHHGNDLFSFNYLGRHSLKGVISDKPYPVFALDTERSSIKKSIKLKEQALLNRSKPEPLQVFEFLSAFMDDELIEKPALRFKEGDPSPEQTVAYTAYANRWQAEAEATDKSIDLQVRSAAEPGEQSAEVVTTEPLKDAYAFMKVIEDLLGRHANDTEEKG